MKLYIPKEEDYFKSYSKELEQYIEKLEHENERIYTKLDDNDKEIERLNNLLKETSQTLSEQTTKAITLKSENERLNNIINKALRKLRATKDHYKIEDINNAIIYTIRILERSDKVE